MNTEELYKLKNSVKKELIPVVDELITLRELRERMELENKYIKRENEMMKEFNISLLHVVDLLGGDKYYED